MKREESKQFKKRNYDKKDRNDRPPREFVHREPREKKTFEFNPDSNFRKYYLNDPEFFQAVIKKEEPPFEFKIHLFLDNPNKEESPSNQELT